MKRARWARDVMTGIAYLAVTIFVGTITVPIAEAQSIELVGTFSGPSHPDTALIQGTGGLLYGTTGGGGNDLVFEVPLNGTPFTPIHTLQCSTEGCAGGDSLGALIQIGDFLYGTRTLSTFSTSSSECAAHPRAIASRTCWMAARRSCQPFTAGKHSTPGHHAGGRRRHA